MIIIFLHTNVEFIGEWENNKIHTNFILEFLFLKIHRKKNRKDAFNNS